MSEDTELTVRRIDPEPFTIIAAVTGVVGAATGTIALWRDIKRPLPSRVRSKILRQIDSLDDELLHLDADLSVVEQLFARSEFPNGRYVRLGNGARMTPADFATYERLASYIFRRLDRVYCKVLALEKLTVTVPYMEEEKYTHHIGESGGRLQELLASRDLSIEKSWHILRDAILHIRELCREIREQLH